MRDIRWETGLQMCIKWICQATRAFERFQVLSERSSWPDSFEILTVTFIGFQRRISYFKISTFARGMKMSHGPFWVERVRWRKKNSQMTGWPVQLVWPISLRTGNFSRWPGLADCRWPWGCCFSFTSVGSGYYHSLFLPDGFWDWCK